VRDVWVGFIELEPDDSFSPHARGGGTETSSPWYRLVGAASCRRRCRRCRRCPVAAAAVAAVAAVAAAVARRRCRRKIYSLILARIVAHTPGTAVCSCRLSFR